MDIQGFKRVNTKENSKQKGSSVKHHARIGKTKSNHVITFSKRGQEMLEFCGNPISLHDKVAIYASKRHIVLIKDVTASNKLGGGGKWNMKITCNPLRKYFKGGETFRISEFDKSGVKLKRTDE